MKRKLIVLLVVILLAFAGYKYIYQEHRDIEKEKAEFIVSTSSISNEFSQNSIKAEKKYLNKTVQFNGTITEINEKAITLNNTIFCLFNNKINKSLALKNKVTIKGRCIGYDDLLEVVKIDQSTIIE